MKLLCFAQAGFTAVATALAFQDGSAWALFYGAVTGAWIAIGQDADL